MNTKQLFTDPIVQQLMNPKLIDAQQKYLNQVGAIQNLKQQLQKSPQLNNTDHNSIIIPPLENLSPIEKVYKQQKPYSSYSKQEYQQYLEQIIINFSTQYIDIKSLEQQFVGLQNTVLQHDERLFNQTKLLQILSNVVEKLNIQLQNQPNAQKQNGEQKSLNNDQIQILQEHVFVQLQNNQQIIKELSRDNNEIKKQMQLVLNENQQLKQEISQIKDSQQIAQNNINPDIQQAQQANYKYVETQKLKQYQQMETQQQNIESLEIPKASVIDSGIMSQKFKELMNDKLQITTKTTDSDIYTGDSKYFIPTNQNDTQRPYSLEQNSIKIQQQKSNNDNYKQASAGDNQFQELSSHIQPYPQSHQPDQNEDKQHLIQLIDHSLSKMDRVYSNAEQHENEQQQQQVYQQLRTTQQGKILQDKIEQRLNTEFEDENYHSNKNKLYNNQQNEQQIKQQQSQLEKIKIMAKTGSPSKRVAASTAQANQQFINSQFGLETSEQQYEYKPTQAQVRFPQTMDITKFKNFNDQLQGQYNKNLNDKSVHELVELGMSQVKVSDIISTLQQQIDYQKQQKVNQQNQIYNLQKQNDFLNVYQNPQQNKQNENQCQQSHFKSLEQQIQQEFEKAQDIKSSKLQQNIKQLKQQVGNDYQQLNSMRSELKQNQQPNTLPTQKLKKKKHIKDKK